MRSKKIFLLLCLILTGCTSKTYTITFDTFGGEVMESVSLKEGETIKEIPLPKREGYLFVGWLRDGIEYNIDNPIDNDMTLTARWVEIPEILDNYTVTFVVDGKEEYVRVKENDVVDEPSHSEKDNYLFLGWYLGKDKYDFNSVVTKDIILTARYKLDVVTVSYDLDGGIGTNKETIIRNNSVSIPDVPKKEGYKFIKWILDGKDFSFTTRITKDITLRAVWEKIEYINIEFDTDGGNKIDSMVVEKYSKLNKLPIPKKEGYKFIEWQINNEKVDNDMVITNDIVLKAIYQIDDND